MQYNQISLGTPRCFTRQHIRPARRLMNKHRQTGIAAPNLRRTFAPLSAYNDDEIERISWDELMKDPSDDEARIVDHNRAVLELEEVLGRKREKDDLAKNNVRIKKKYEIEKYIEKAQRDEFRKSNPAVAVKVQETLKLPQADNIIDGLKRKLNEKMTWWNEVPEPMCQISYAFLLENMYKKRLKRIWVINDGRAAVAEIVYPGFGKNQRTTREDWRVPGMMLYAEEDNNELMVEKMRFYVELPGDVWEEGTFMSLIKQHSIENRVIVEGANAHGELTKEYRIPYKDLLEYADVRPELAMVDATTGKWVWLSMNYEAFVNLGIVFGLQMVLTVVERAYKILGKGKKDPKQEFAEQVGAHRAKEYNVERKGGKKADTGVRYSDIGGIDRIRDEIVEAVDILLAEKNYDKAGAKPLRGIVLEGPPGTGKTLLAKAMAGEAQIPFLSANGAEFVEMFSGVAAARVRSLFKAAREKAPAIIFIDEIDAIGKARSSLGGDAGSSEREQGLLALLTEMDGFVRDDRVLVIGATNRVDILDAALMRPGRFDRTIYMGLPTEENRLSILKVHARNKNFSPSREEVLKELAALTTGFSGAELANLLNEAAILSVRKDDSTITLAICKEIIDKARLGFPSSPLPDSEAKRRYAIVVAARGVAAALTTGLPRLDYVSIMPRGSSQSFVMFVRGDDEKDPSETVFPGAVQNAVEVTRMPSHLEMLCELLTPLYVGRCAEEVLFGTDAVTLLTGKEVSVAGELARYIVRDSGFHPSFRDSLVRYKALDPMFEFSNEFYDEATMNLQKLAYFKARKLVQERRPVIEQVAKEMYDDPQETVQGERIIELLKLEPLAPADALDSELLTLMQEEDGASDFAELSSSEEYTRLAEVVMGRRDLWELMDLKTARSKATAVQQQLLTPEGKERLEEMRELVQSGGSSEYPSLPKEPLPDRGEALDQWMAQETAEILL